MRSIPLYAVIKGGLTQMTKALAAEWAEDGIRVNQINPGLVRSDAFKGTGIPEEHQEAFYEFNISCKTFWTSYISFRLKPFLPIAQLLLSD